MPDAHSAGKIYWHRIRVQRDAPWRHEHLTFEYEEPFRYGMGHVIHLPRFKTGIVVGRWLGELEWDEAALLASQGRVEAADVKGEGGESVAEHRDRRLLEAAIPEGWTVS